MRTPLIVLLVFVVVGCGGDERAVPAKAVDADVVATFSIVARDPDTGDLGVAVQSKFLGVGAVVPWARADVGAVATQAYANTTFGPRGLELLDDGMPAEDVVAALIRSDEGRAQRQLGIVDASGGAAAHTGDDCDGWAGHLIGDGYCCQGNILVGEPVVRAMAKAFEKTDAPLPERLVAALAAGQAKGGDKRGRQSAVLLVVRRGGGYAGWNDRWIDLRVDDHPDPVVDLARVLALHRRVFGKARLAEMPEGLVREPRQDESTARAAWDAWRRDALAGRPTPVTQRVALLEGTYVGTRLEGPKATLFVFLPGRRGLHQVLLARAESGNWAPQ